MVNFFLHLIVSGDGVQTLISCGDLVAKVKKIIVDEIANFDVTTRFDVHGFEIKQGRFIQLLLVNGAQLIVAKDT